MVGYLSGLLHSRQLQDVILLQQQQNSPDKYPTINIDGTELICYLSRLTSSCYIAN